MGQVSKQPTGKTSGPVSFPPFRTGDSVRVWCRIVERDRVRLAQFEGIVIRRRGGGLGETFSVRRITHGEGVERVFPLHAPILERIEVLSQGRPRRARLYYLRTKIGKVKIASANKPGAAAGVQQGSAAPAAAQRDTAAEPTAQAPTTAA